MIKYYIVMNQDINKDKTKEDLILKYRGDKFLAALPLKNFLDIDKYFSSPPKMPKKYNAVYTYRDYNKDKVKDHIMHLFTLKGKYILSLPINNLATKKYKKLGGRIANHPAMQANHPAMQANHPAMQANHPAMQANHPAMQKIIDDQPQVHTVITKDETSFGQHIKMGFGAGGGAALSSNIVNSLWDAFFSGE
jgi:hypothetical protein